MFWILPTGRGRFWGDELCFNFDILLLFVVVRTTREGGLNAAWWDVRVDNSMVARAWRDWPPLWPFEQVEGYLQS